EQHSLTEAMFAEVRDLLEEKRLLLKVGTIVDATIIHAPSSTKNRERKRDPEMRQTKKGNEWYFGMKDHGGNDVKGIVHHLSVTDAAQADISQLADLQRGAESELYADTGYRSEQDRVELESVGVRYRVN